jgi:hypothetical protein
VEARAVQLYRLPLDPDSAQPCRRRRWRAAHVSRVAHIGPRPGHF